ncbi:MAG: hypothetical protein AAF223_17345, partial [Bacteroidota bacterium]
MKIPGYAKYLIILAAIILTAYLLIVTKSVLSPVFTALILALLLRPVSSWLERVKIHQWSLCLMLDLNQYHH